MSALMYQLRFGLDPNNWRLYQLRDLDQRFKALKTRILELDKHTCLYCGFQAFKYFCVLNYDFLTKYQYFSKNNYNISGNVEFVKGDTI